MFTKTLICSFILLFSIVCDSTAFTANEKYPTVLIAILVRNKEPILPYFLSYLSAQDYPKDRISLWIKSDHNVDRSSEIVKSWIQDVESEYHSLTFDYNDDPALYSTESNTLVWVDERFSNIINLREEALNHGRRIWTDYVLYLDADTLLVWDKTIFHLVQKQYGLIAPMLLSDGLYSNFWGGMSSDYYYRRTDEYKEIYKYEKKGLFHVPMIHSVFLVNLRHSRSDFLTFNRTILQSNIVKLRKLYGMNFEYDGPSDDTIVFAMSANFSGIPMIIDNEELFGFITAPLEEDEEFEKDRIRLRNLLIIAINAINKPPFVMDSLQKYVHPVEKRNLGFSNIYMINLERRSERRIKMQWSFDVLGIDVETFFAVDGRNLTDSYLDEINVRIMDGYSDPYHYRTMTKGEVGCFLSHYYIWERMVKLEQKEVLILEDDVIFEPYFLERAENIMNEARSKKNWDLLYFGRKRLDYDNETFVENSNHILKAHYSYWTLGYVITLEGAKKLLDAKPLENLIPVDEFLPVMFNQHPNDTFSEIYKNRNLVAWSAQPLLLFPTHYTGDEGYFSDTEDSDEIVTEESENKGKKENSKQHREMNSDTELPKGVRSQLFDGINDDIKVSHTEL